ncbi:MAG: hypothetical protein HQK51_03845 [Oligoflexia bacterium]|nr:hypothetical protein [Oligoflexia bacterium]
MNENCHHSHHSHTDEDVCEIGMTECQCHVNGGHHHKYCPFQKTIDRLNEAYYDAVHEVYVSILKDKIQKAWGTQVEKAAEALCAEKNTDWMAELSKSKAQHDLKDQMKKILSEEKK